MAQLLAFPIGTAWARFLPNIKIFGISLNPGPFTIKEHVLVTVMATVGAYSAYATDIVAVQRVFYNQNYNFGCEHRTLFFRLYSSRKLKASVYRSMDDCHVHTAHRFLYWRYRSPVLGPATFHEYVYHLSVVISNQYSRKPILFSLALQSRHMCSFQHPPRTEICWHG